jgi:hypothetical protein
MEQTSVENELEHAFTEWILNYKSSAWDTLTSDEAFELASMHFENFINIFKANNKAGTLKLVLDEENTVGENEIYLA